jgi:uncharacterized membrane protein
VDALPGALSDHFSDYGIDDGFIKKVREKVTEGTSALFLLTSEVTFDKVEDVLANQRLIARRLPFRQAALTNSTEAVRLAKIQYEAGSPRKARARQC